jgi:hypothetical protein
MFRGPGLWFSPYSDLSKQLASCRASCPAADKVDVLSWRKKNGRVHAQIRDMCAILCGLVVAQVNAAWCIVGALVL